MLPPLLQELHEVMIVRWPSLCFYLSVTSLYPYDLVLSLGVMDGAWADPLLQQVTLVFPFFLVL